MDTKKVEKYTKLLAFIYYHPGCELGTVLEELRIKRGSTYKALELWIKEKKVVKVRKKQIIMGKHKDLYSLTSEGEELFFRLKEALNKSQQQD